MIGDPRVPVTVLAGFLGAGKTTLLNRLLSEARGRRIGVLVNDFGAVNIDAALVRAVHDDTVELTNGCICCAIQEDLLQAIWALLERPNPPEHLIVEASGVADPGAIGFTLAAAGRHGAIRLDTVVTLFDVLAVDEVVDLELDGLRQRQLAPAGLVVLTKTDLATPDQLQRARHLATEAAPRAAILDGAEPGILATLLDESRGWDTSVVSGHAEPHGLRSWFAESDRPVISLRALSSALSQLPAGIVRVKGIVALADLPGQPVIVHRVGLRTDVHPAPPAVKQSGSRLVAIGRASELQPASLDAWFDALLG